MRRPSPNGQAETPTQRRRGRSNSRDSTPAPSTFNSNPSFQGQRVSPRPKSRDIWQLLKEIGLVKRQTIDGNVPLTRQSAPVRRSQSLRSSSSSIPRRGQSSRSSCSSIPKRGSDDMGAANQHSNQSSMRSNRSYSDATGLAKKRSAERRLPERYYRPYPIPASPKALEKSKPTETKKHTFTFKFTENVSLFKSY